jgi:hypothetical protein
MQRVPQSGRLGNAVERDIRRVLWDSYEKHKFIHCRQNEILMLKHADMQ